MEIANEPNSPPPDPGSLRQTIFSLIQVETWEERKSIIEAHPELLGDKADSMMGQLGQTAAELDNLLGFSQSDIDSKIFPVDIVVGSMDTDSRDLSNTAQTAIFESLRLLLRRCHEVGVKQTFGELEAHSNALSIFSKFQDDLKLAEGSVENYNLTGDQAALDDAVAGWERILNHPDFPRAEQSFISTAKNEACKVYRQLYVARGEIPDLSRAIDLLQQAVSATPEGHSDLPGRLNSLGIDLIYRYERLCRIEDLNESISVCRQAVAATSEGHPSLPTYLNSLGNGLRYLYERLGRIEDLEEAIRVYRQAVAATPEDHSDLSGQLNSLGNGLTKLFERLGRIKDLEEAIKVYRKAMAATPEGNLNLPIILNNLSISLRDLYQCLGRIEDLEEAIKVSRQAVTATPEENLNLPMYLNNLGVNLSDLYERLGRIGDLEEAIKVSRQAVAATQEGNLNLPMYLNSLGANLSNLYERLGRIKDLEEGIKVCRQAVAATPEGHANLPWYLNSLDISLRDLYQCLGRIEDLEEAINVSRQAVSATPEDHPGLPGRLNNLGNGLRDLYQRIGRIEDLEEAINVSRQAVAATPEGHPDLPGLLSSLGNGLSGLYQRLGRIEDLEEAIEVCRHAVAATPEGHTDLPTYLNNLGNGLNYLYERLGRIEDLEEAIKVSRHAVAATPEGNLNLPMHLNSLAAGLNYLYQRIGRIEDLEEAIKVYRQAVAATPEGHPDLPIFLNNLGAGLSGLHQRLGRIEDLEEAIGSFRRACNQGVCLAPEETMIASRNWQLLAFQRKSWLEVVEAYGFIRRLTEQRLSSQFARSDKSFSLGVVEGLTSQVAYAHLQLDQLREAVEVLEGGQAQLLREALERKRRDLERLQELGFNQLYERFIQASERYEFLLSLAHSENRPSDWLEQVNHVVQEMNYSAEAIRNDAGKENPEYRFFLRSLPFEEIQKQANEAPLIYLAATSSGGMALVVNGISLEVIELPELSDITLRKNVLGLNDAPQLGGYLGAYEKWRNNNRDLSALAAWLMALKETTRWLWDKIMGKVLAHLEAKGIREAVLIPTGLLGLLPLHAAWTEDLSRLTGRRYALDDFTLTYAPSAHALYHARQGANHRADNLLAVENPDGTLRFAKDEVKAVLSHFPGKNNHLMRDQAIKKDVVKAIDVSQVLHFSTHGLAGWQEAESSCLKLADGNLTLGEFFGLRLDQARLAVLSACETGVIGTKLPDEVVSLPSALMQAGVPGVIGSLWSVLEINTAMLMAQFYDLWRDSHLSPPEALRQAQIWLRDSTVEELKRQFKSSMESHGSDLSVETAKSFYKEIGFKNPKARLFDHPFYWAAFEYTGL